MALAGAEEALNGFVPDAADLDAGICQNRRTAHPKGFEQRTHKI